MIYGNVSLMQLLDGRKAREHCIPLLIERIKSLPFTPCLVIIQVGDRADSNIYINGKKKFAEKIGVKVVHEKLKENIKEEEIFNLIKKHNENKDVNGIIIQLPLPAHLNPDKIINNIDPNKDIDGLTENTKFIPATAKGVLNLFKFYNLDLKNKKVTVVGQSKLVGRPISVMCEREGAIVTSCDSKTEDLQKETRKAEVLIVAIGKPNFIDENYISKDQVVIDVGITRNIDGTTVDGDVNFEKVKEIVSMITPVPGGVGQMTVLALFENLIDACYNASN